MCCKCFSKFDREKLFNVTLYRHDRGAKKRNNESRTLLYSKQWTHDIYFDRRKNIIDFWKGKDLHILRFETKIIINTCPSLWCSEMNWLLVTYNYWHAEILDSSMRICFPVCDAINFKIKLNFRIKLFYYMTKNVRIKI